MENQKKAFQSVDSDRPKNKDGGWDTGSCPFFFFGDDIASENDLQKACAFLDGVKEKIKARFKKNENGG